MRLPTLKDRRERGDLIMLYKIENHMEKDIQAKPGITDRWRSTYKRTLQEDQEESMFKEQ